MQQREPQRRRKRAMRDKGWGLPIRIWAILAASVMAAAPLQAVEPPRLDTGTEAWMLTSTALVLLMLPGVAMLYGGLVRTKNVLGTMLQSFACMAVVGVLWVACGYARAFGKDALGGRGG